MERIWEIPRIPCIGESHLYITETVHLCVYQQCYRQAALIFNTLNKQGPSQTPHISTLNKCNSKEEHRVSKTLIILCRSFDGMSSLFFLQPLRRNSCNFHFVLAEVTEITAVTYFLYPSPTCQQMIPTNYFYCNTSNIFPPPQLKLETKITA